MRFGPVELENAVGCILAHSIQVATRRLKKGTVLNSTDISDLRTTGVDTVICARLEQNDLSEDAAATALAETLTNAHISASAAFTGRANLFADTAGVLQIDVDAINALNCVDEAVTLATLPNSTRVMPGTMIGTVKIISYGVSKNSLSKITLKDALCIAPFKLKTASLILTKTPALTDKVLTKGKSVIVKRANDLGLEMIDQAIVEHKSAAIAKKLRSAKGEILLILGASATSDPKDVSPTGLIEAGGSLTRFGMPVDPGNLLFLGELDGRPVVGLPGCARSPVLNGADWVLERLVAGLNVSFRSIAEMGVGGLLKENPKRPQPRVAKPLQSRPNIDVILLAAGASRRMRGEDKLLKRVWDTPLLRHLTQEMLNSHARNVHVVLRPEDDARHAVTKDLNAKFIKSPDWKLGMSASIFAGLSSLEPDSDGVIVALADMPEITGNHINKLIAGFSPDDEREIVRAISADGTPGHPVLFGRRFFESLSALSGDRGARELLQNMQEFITGVPLNGDAATTDLDTPEAWEKWQNSENEQL